MKHVYVLFLDDERDVENVYSDLELMTAPFITVRSSAEAISTVITLGPPSALSLDHDLGGDDTSMVFLRWLSENMDEIPAYKVHSANPVGRDNILSFMSSWKKSKQL